MQRNSLLFLVASALLACSDAWVTPSACSSRRSSNTIRFMVESVSVESLQDHETVGAELSGSIQRWLDAEWMPQAIHKTMGESCKASYLNCRQRGEHDLMTIMTTVAGDLEQKWGDYDKDAFVGPWDITNYVSDFLTERAGLERCSCSSQIY